MGEGENYLKCNLPWFQLLGNINLSWQGECIEFICAAECKWERAQVNGKRT